MEITEHASGDLLELQVTGMLDANWSDHLASAIDAVVRQGHHRVVVNLSGITYLSSAGVAVLVRSHKQFKAFHGFFGVCEASHEAYEVLRLTGLARLLMCDRQDLGSPGHPAASAQESRRFAAEQGGLATKQYDVVPGGKLTCRLFGNPLRLAGCRFEEADSRRVAFGRSSIGLGLGAFGADFVGCRDRFGEFLAVAGTAAQLPTHQSSTPDYQLAVEEYIPEAQVLYGLAAEGEFSQMGRFEPGDEIGMAPLSTIVEHCLQSVRANLAGIVVIAESAGLVGAALRRSPALEMAGASSLFQHPQVRDWLSFTPERAYPHSLALVVGVACRGIPEGPAAPLAPFLRPLDSRGKLQGHFHAAAFSYRPLKKGKLDLQLTVATLFEAEVLQGVLHLLADDRGVSGAGESEFIRGAYWVGPIETVMGGGNESS